MTFTDGGDERVALKARSLDSRLESSNLGTERRTVQEVLPTVMSIACAAQD